MIILGNLLLAIAQLLGAVLWIFYVLLIANIILSWVNPDPRNFIVQFVYGTTEPILRRIRAKIRPVGMFDLSALILLLAVYFLDTFLVRSIAMYGGLMLHQVTP